MRPGELVWIGIRSARKGPILTQLSAVLLSGRGIEGDHYDTQRNGPRQVTLIGLEDIAPMASFLGREDIEPELLRRNFVTEALISWP